ncbi:MAG: aspartyl protease family protein [Sphingomonas bacterium]|nr:aspartyl protease family protein [Sphingomonas bacterium]
MISIVMALAAAVGTPPTVVATSSPVSRFEALSQPPADDPSAAPDKLGFARDSYQRMTVPVRLGGKGPFRFLVDTGSDRTAISRELAATLDLDPGPRARLHSATGETQVAMAIIPSLILSRKTLGRIDAPLLDAADIGADGILGIDALRSERLSFDFIARTVSISTAQQAPDNDDRDAIIVRAKRRDGRLVITDAAAEGHHVSVVLDTGSQYSVGNAALRRALERRGALDIRGPIELVSVTGATLRGELAVIRDLQIGGTTVRGLAIVFADAHTFRQLDLDRRPAILLGMNGLESFDKMSIDFASRKLSLSVSRTSPPPSRIGQR